jgi:2-C-methyl-D-erythritol 4-phosphate cytidylyltransferase
MATFTVILPAAGKSTRFGGPDKKPFISLDGRPIWQRAAELFWNRANVSRLLIVIDPEDHEEFRSRFAHLLAFTNARLVAGGQERFDSVANALAECDPDSEFVAVHDAVRPLTPTALIDAVFAEAIRHGAAMLAIPVADTLKRVDPQTMTVQETVSRSGLWQAQTPQVFRRDWLTCAYEQRSQLGEQITDDAQLVEASGHPVRIVPGSPWNFKITTKDDLILAEALLKNRTSRDNQRPKPLRFGEEEAIW